MYYLHTICLFFLTVLTNGKAFDKISNIRRIWLPNVNGTTASIVIVAENGLCNEWCIEPRNLPIGQFKF